MLLKINKSTTLSTGQAATAPVIELFNENPNLSEGVIFADLKVWSSQANKDSGKDHTYLYHADTTLDEEQRKRITNFTYRIPQADIASVLADGTDQAYGIIGDKYITYVKTALAKIAGCVVGDIEVLSLG